MLHTLLRDAPVSISVGHTVKKNKPFAIADIGGQFEHQFDVDSRVSKALSHTPPEQLAERLSGGQYFFLDDNLIDFRDGNYNGFVHTDQSVDKLVTTLGIQPAERGHRHVRTNQVSNDFFLGKKWSDHEIIVPNYADGGQFSSELNFAWNPFVKTIQSQFMLWRLICENGMRGMTSLLNTKIPLVNRWEEHLEIANHQIQNKVNGMIIGRLGAMGDERATVAETLNVAHHAQTRLSSGKVLMETEKQRLRTIADIAHPMIHIEGYRPNVFSDNRLAAQLPAHLNTFDVYNMLTELRSHTTASDKSSDAALDKAANTLVFDRKDLTQHVSRYALPQQSSFSSPDTAFFGEMAA